jgi:hypothetical protein
MVRTVSRALLACVFALLVVLAQQTTAPPGPDIQTPPTTQDAANSRNRLVIGVAAIVLLGIVILGRRLRSKRKKDSGGS